MKKQYLEPSIDVIVLSDLMQGEVITPGSKPPEGHESDAKENDMFDDEDEDEECLNSPNLWD